MILIDTAPTSQFETLQAAQRAGAQLPDGLITVALTGRHFRGQRQRAWAVVRGNLHLVAHYRLDLAAADTEAAALVMLPAVAAVESIERVSAGGCQPTIKWVNDLFLPLGKVAGVLTATQIEADRIVSALFGIGINLEHAPPLVPTQFVPRAAALTDTDPRLCGHLPRLFVALVAALDAAIHTLRTTGPTPLYQRYRARSACMGQSVRLWPAGCDNPDHTPLLAQGRVADIRPDLSLVLDGRTEAVRNARLAWPPTGSNHALDKPQLSTHASSQKPR